MSKERVAMYKNSVGRKENATGLLAGAFLLIVLSPIWLVIAIGLFFPLLVAGFLGWAIVGLVYQSVKPAPKKKALNYNRRK
jgi:hypothetical protein